MKTIICLFAKPPLAGMTKSRLAKTIGSTAAAELSAAMLKDIITQCMAVMDTEIFIAYPPQSTPDDFSTVHKTGLNYIVQQGNNLGERMANIFQTFLVAKQANKVIIIGSDCITTSTASITQALAKLTDFPVVIGPARDGGYVLVGQSMFNPGMFTNIDWGSGKVLDQTTVLLDSAQVKYYKMPSSFDIDHHEDLAELKVFLKNNSRPFTEEFLNGMILL
ncbi:MAG: TIGR04282 family arsenosugar biosynthesis glycosyltransferase [Victivallaceae bacterium]|nr:TIGR04282 family arsenosugar biosynthesis glycosyltransferase [Victivallaceae bacterium]